MSEQNSEHPIDVVQVVQYHSRRLAELVGEIEALTARIARLEQSVLPREPDEDIGLP